MPHGTRVLRRRCRAYCVRSRPLSPRPLRPPPGPRQALVKAEAALVAEALQTGRRRSSAAVINDKNCCNPIVRARYKHRCQRCCRRTFCGWRRERGPPRDTTPSSRSAGGGSTRNGRSGSARDKVLSKLGEDTELGERQKIAQAALFVRVRACSRCGAIQAPGSQRRTHLTPVDDVVALYVVCVRVRVVLGCGCVIPPSRMPLRSALCVSAPPASARQPCTRRTTTRGCARSW